MEFITAHKDEVRAEVTISVTGYIGDDFRGGDFISYIRNWHDTEEKIILDFFSFGGSAFDAIAVYEFLTINGYQVEANIYGFCGSAATIIACAAGSVNMGQHSFFFVHNAFNRLTGEQDPGAEKVSEQMVEIYQKKTGLNRRVIKKLMADGDGGMILGAKEAKEYGFVDKVVKEQKSIAAAWGDRFTPESGAADFQNHKSEDTMAFNLMEWVKATFGQEVKTEAEAQTFLTEKAPGIVQAAAASTEGASKLEDRIKAIEAALPSQDEGGKIAELEQNLATLADNVAQLAEAVKESQAAIAASVEAKAKQESEFQQRMKSLGDSIQTIRAAAPAAPAAAAPAAPADGVPAVTAQAQQAVQNPNVVVSNAADAVLARMTGKANNN